MAQERYWADDLRAFAARLMEKSGLPGDRAAAVAEVLVEGDLMGKTTHGLALMPLYLKELKEGGMARAGEPATVADGGGVFTWDGGYLPGPWLVGKAITEADARIATHGVVTAVIRRSHHIGALQAYLLRATASNLMMILMASDPREESVAPHGGLAPRYSPNPVAVGIPTTGAPILVDVSLSTTANGVVNRAHAERRTLPGPWLKDAQGRPSDDPAVRFTEPAGALYPLGGADLGYKGFGLGLMVEALTAALGGHGRADRPTGWGASVFVQLIDPSAFGGIEAFRRETGFLADFCRSSPVAEGDPAVQMPGEGALRRRAEQMAAGVRLYPGIFESLQERAAELAVEVPSPIG